MCILNWITIKWIICKRLNENDYLYLFLKCRVLNTVLSLFLNFPFFYFYFWFSISPLYFCIFRCLDICISAFSLLCTHKLFFLQGINKWAFHIYNGNLKTFIKCMMNPFLRNMYMFIVYIITWHRNQLGL